MSIDPAALAREVLDAHDAWGKTIAGSDECARASDAFTSALRCNGGDLARAVIDLTATIKRVEALADDMDHDADLLDRTDDLRLHLIAATHREDATRLRTALNGGDA